MPSQHDLLQDLKRVAVDLGRAPVRDEYRKLGRFTDREVSKVFGGFSLALIAAGLQPVMSPRNRSRDRFKDLHRASIEETLSVPPKQLQALDPALEGGILCIGDFHAPFVEVGALSALYEFVERVKPRKAVQMGDLYDMYSHGKFPRSRCIYNPAEEAKLGLKLASEMWATIQKLSPGIRCHQILGNHDVRPLKRVLEATPEGEPFFAFDQYFRFNGVETLMDPRQPLVIDDIAFTHGYLSQIGAHRDFLNKNVVCGHSHQGGVNYKNFQNPVSGRSQIKWELNCGYLGDPSSKALSYTPLKITKWTLGWGYIDAYGPRFIPL